MYYYSQTKKWLICATALVILGALVFALAMTLSGWDFTRLDTVKYEPAVYEPEEAFHSVTVTSNTADVTFLLSEEGKCRVEADESENLTYTVKVENGILNVELNDSRKWYEYIGITAFSPKLKIYLPKAELDMLTVRTSTGDISVTEGLSPDKTDIRSSTADISFRAKSSGAVKIEATTGDISIDGIEAAEITLSVSSGDITVSNTVTTGDVCTAVSTGSVRLINVKCHCVSSKGGTGDVYLSDVIGEVSIYIKRSTGDAVLKSVDAEDINIETSTGDIVGSVLTPKDFEADAGTGDVSVPESRGGGSFKAKTGTGDIRISLASD
jgi:DUF4097 and DUF4098 domain-containing protein YvlB